ncbi:hypothetical protein NKG99_09350 [Mesorhizobium sp. M1409]|uniref:hypothetical protein n=1 Tax=unclassified Mesorhizobium TaxID=325217 RepID=UPI00333DE535
MSKAKETLRKKVENDAQGWRDERKTARIAEPTDAKIPRSRALRAGGNAIDSTLQPKERRYPSRLTIGV